jgi:hypothetical protein
MSLSTLHRDRSGRKHAASFSVIAPAFIESVRGPGREDIKEKIVRQGNGNIQIKLQELGRRIYRKDNRKFKRRNKEHINGNKNS